MTHLIDLLDKAVQRAIWDGNGRVGVNVSGGLDSSTICRVAHRWADLPTFTGYYAHPGFDEREYARMAVAKYPRSWHQILITPQDFADNFDDAMTSFTPPYQGPGMFGQYMVAKHIRENTDVQIVLSGEGSDELFGGYARLLAVAGDEMPDGYENYKPPAGYPTTLKAALEYDWVRLPDLLKVDDEALAAFGLEARSPFTDQPVVDYAMRLSPAQRIGKHHLRAAVRGLVPDPIIDRTDKMGMPIPIVKWANGPLKDFIGDRLGYIPDPNKPFDRAWWAELCDKYTPASTIAA